MFRVSFIFRKPSPGIFSLFKLLLRSVMFRRNGCHRRKCYLLLLIVVVLLGFCRAQDRARDRRIRKGQVRERGEQKIRGHTTREQRRRKLFGQMISFTEGIGGLGGQSMNQNEFGVKRDPISFTARPTSPPLNSYTGQQSVPQQSVPQQQQPSATTSTTTTSTTTSPATAQTTTVAGPPTGAPPVPLYQPGNLTHEEEGLLLSEGLTCRLVAESGRAVPYANGRQSYQRFHDYPDGGDTFIDLRPENPGGWVYVSNSEVWGGGSVGAVTFNHMGDVIDYRRLLENTDFNCGGGKTPWNTWISCEESGNPGRVWQVDPLGIRPPEVTSLGEGGGEFESFAYDIRNIEVPRFFVTEDESDGALRRFTPHPENVNWAFPWDMLHGSGTMVYLILQPDNQRLATRGTYVWTTDKYAAEQNALLYYPKSEGIDVYGNRLYFVCKEVQYLFELNLDTMTYTRQSTAQGLFSSEPDQVVHVLGGTGESYLYFTEDGGFRNGIHARNSRGEYFTVLESLLYTNDETTGVSFSPDGKHLYFAYQGRGLLFDVMRLDGLSFHASVIDLKYHSQHPGTSAQHNSRRKKK